MSLIEHRIRHEDEPRGVRLCDWPIDDTPGLLEVIRYNGGVYYKGNSRTDLAHQIVYENRACFVEIIICEPIEPDGRSQ